MSAISNLEKRILLVVDTQNDVMTGAFQRAEIVFNINKVVAKARSAGVPVIWVQHSDHEMPLNSHGWEIVSDLSPLQSEHRIHKTFRSAFESTNLSQILANLSIGHIFVCGAQSNNCIRHTCHSAIERGYDLTLISDAHTTTDYEWQGRSIDAEQVINEQNDNFASYALPERSVNIVAVADIAF